MTPRKPQAGDRYRYVGELPLGVDAGQLLPGTIVTIRNVGSEEKPLGVLPAGEKGAHDDTEDAVVVEWEAPGTVITEVKEEPYERPEVVHGPDGNPLLDDNGELRIEPRPRKRSIPVLGHGTVSRAMSIGLNGRDFVDAAGQTQTFPSFNKLFEEA
jgi:hypothetical protein